MSLATLSWSAPTIPVLPQRKRWTLAEFHQLRAEPWLENRKLILVEGEILEMPNPNPPHDASLLLTTEALRNAFGTGHCIRGQMALVLGLSTDPVPDIAVVPGGPRDYVDHPRTALLVVEISESTLNYDLREKANLYAAGGIREYWVVDLVHRQLVVFRDPVADALQVHGGRYCTATTLEPTAAISPLAMPGAVVSIAELLP